MVEAVEHHGQRAEEPGISHAHEKGFMETRQGQNGAAGDHVAVVEPGEASRHVCRVHEERGEWGQEREPRRRRGVARAFRH
jgi:hypothetical protein